MKKHWASNILQKSFNHYNNKMKTPKFLRLPTPVELGKAKYNALPGFGFEKDGDYTWENYYNEMKKDYPIKYFIYESLSNWIRRNIISPISTFKYYIRSHSIKKYHLLDLRSKEYNYRWGWIDADSQMLLAMMKIMENFIIEQDTVNRLIWLKEEEVKDPDLKDFNWHDSIKFCEDLLEIQKWWRVDRAKNHELLEEQHGKISDYLAYFAAEEKLIKEDDNMMKKLIDMRGRMWT